MSILAAPGPILGHVNKIRDAHRRLHGAEFPWPDAIRLLDRFNAMLDDYMPPKVFEVQVGCFLLQEMYSPEAIRRVLAHVAIFGRAAGSPDLDDDDAEAVEAILPARGRRAFNS
jgi:hypothetical protein